MAGKIQVKFDPSNYEIRSLSVEKQLRPLINHITTLVKSENRIKKGRGKSKKGSVLLTVLNQAITNFIENGEQIAIENKEFSQEITTAVNEVRSIGTEMSSAAQEFIVDPCSSEKRSKMVKSARSLLACVARLLILADMVDVQLLVNATGPVRATLEKLRITSNPEQLREELKNYSIYSKQLLDESLKRQQVLTNPQSQDDLAAARAVLKKSSTMLMSATKSYITHPEHPAAVANRNQLLKQICEAVDTISDVAQGRDPRVGFGKSDGPGRLATNLANLEALDYTQVRTQTLLQEQMKELSKGLTSFAESSSIDKERRDKIMSGAAAVREALQNLLAQSMTKPNEEMNRDIDDLRRKTKQLKRRLGKTVAKEISDNFLEAELSLHALVEAAEKGNSKDVEQCAIAFTEHCNKLVEVINHICEISTNEEGVKMVRYAASQLPELCSGVINAARILAVAPESIVDQQNMQAYKRAWEEQVQILQVAVDNITTIDDILSVLDQSVYEEMNQYLAAIQERNPAKLKTIFEDIQRRTERVCDVVTAEMDNYEPCKYTRKVLTAVKVWTEEIERFSAKTEEIIQTITENPEEEIDENEFIDATRLIYDGIREVRRAVLMNRADDDLDREEVEFEDTITYNTDTLIRKVTETTEVTTIEENSEDMGGITVARQAMDRLPEKEKTKILEQVQNFQSEKQTFDKEVAKWDDADNDIIVLSKYMCLIMIQMTDFVRQRGPLKSTTDVINAAKKISETGVKFNKLTQQIAEHCPESSTKNDLLAYSERVAMYSHQINMIAKVKADVENTSNEELITAGVESATSLIENAKNLMNAVVLTVKSSYVASTKYARQGTTVPSIVVWRMKAPEKKPLVRSPNRKEVRAVVRKASQRKTQDPIKILAEFEGL